MIEIILSILPHNFLILFSCATCFIVFISASPFSCSVLRLCEQTCYNCVERILATDDDLTVSTSAGCTDVKFQEVQY